MSPQVGDEIVVRKRRRRAAVDPCLGYYGPSGDATPATTSGVPRVLVPETSSPVVRYEENDPQDGPPSDLMMITVEDFLRQQATSSSPKRCKMTYSRKKRRTATRRIHLSSSDVYSQSCAGESPSDDSESSGSVARVRRSARKAKLRKAPLPSRSVRKMQTRTDLTSRFSKRMQRAAVLSHVDQEVQVDSLDMAPLPLSLVPFDTYLIPSSPLKSKRSKLVDPRLPRQLDSTFFSNEILSKTKPYMPFLRWGPSRTLAAEDLPKTLPRVNRKKLPVCRSEGSSTLVPLELVTYEAHSEGRSMKFNQNAVHGVRRVISPVVSRITHKGPTPLLLPADNQDALNPTSCEGVSLHKPVCNDPFLSCISRSVHEVVRTNEEGPFSTEFCHELVKSTSATPTDIHSSITQNKPTESTNSSLRRAYTVDPGLSSKRPFVLPAPTLARNYSPFASHPEHPRSHSNDKPMRGIGTLLDSLMETARGVLVSQSQSQSQGNPDESTVDHRRKSKPRPRSGKTILPGKAIGPDELAVATTRGQVDRHGKSKIPSKITSSRHVLSPPLRRVPSQSYGHVLKTANNFIAVDNLQLDSLAHRNTVIFISNAELTSNHQEDFSDLLNENTENTRSHSPGLFCLQ